MPGRGTQEKKVFENQFRNVRVISIAVTKNVAKFCFSDAV